MKFDYIIQNPPYSKSLHLDFLKLGFNILSDTGRMVIIEPSTWLINIRTNGKAKLYNEIKTLLNKHVYKVIIDNYNHLFNTETYVPFSITYIDKSKIYNTIDFYNCGEYHKVTNLYNCNLIGDYKVIYSILNKCLSFNDIMSKHIYKNQIINKNTYFIPFSSLCASTPIAIDSKRPKSSNNLNRYYKTVNGYFYKVYFHVLYHKSYEIKNYVPKSFAAGGNTTTNKKYSDKDTTCIFGTKEELENWKYFVFNNKLPLFLNLLLTIDQHNNSINYVPWLVDKKYTDDEIYKLFNFTNEEINLINKTINKFERDSLWFKRYFKGCY